MQFIVSVWLNAKMCINIIDEVAVTALEAEQRALAEIAEMVGLISPVRVDVQSVRS